MRHIHSLLNLLLIELACCWQRKQHELLRCEAAFLITQKYCDELQQSINEYDFTDDTEEIDFFKQLHPQFAGHLLYYSILYEALTSVPACPHAAKIFWEKESKRYERFQEKNQAFLSYLSQHGTDLDDHFFLRKHFRASSSPQEKIQWDPHCCTIGSHAAASWFAEKNYHDYVKST